MATTRLIPMHKNVGKSVSACLGGRTDYAKNPEKTDGGNLVTAYQCNPQIVDQEFLLSKREYFQNTGRTPKGDVIAYHLRQSFKPGEITPELANEIGYKLAENLTHGNHAFLVCTHVDKAHIHNHIIFNSTSLDCQKKFRNFKGSTSAVRKMSDRLCLRNGLSIVEYPAQAWGYGQWLGDKKPRSQRADLAEAIHKVLFKAPSTLEEFLQQMTKEGFEIKQGKTLAFRRPGKERFIRVESLGEGYSFAEIRAKIAGKPISDPGKSVIDIQAKLREGRGSAYENWAKSFNLKQSAQSLSYLHHNNLLHTHTMNDTAETLTEKVSNVEGEIQEVERQMAEIKAMEIQVIRYHRTRNIFAEYRESGYNQDFFEKHREPLTMHQATKKFFDEKHVTVLPTVFGLQGEYAELSAKKNQLYSQYHQANDELKPLLIAKKNIETLLARPSRPGRPIKQKSYER